MERILIHFGDNDLCVAFAEVGKLLYKAMKNDCLVENREKIAHITNNLSYGCRTLFQSHENTAWDELKSHMQITKDNVYIDDNVDEWMKGHAMNNEAVVIDLNFDYDGNNPVYLY